MSHAPATHPRRAAPAAAARTAPDALARPAAGVCELHCRSNFSFLTGASHPEELVARAAQLGYAAIAITDECSVAGVVRAHEEAKRQAEGGSAIKLLIGSVSSCKARAPRRLAGWC